MDFKFFNSRQIYVSRITTAWCEETIMKINPNENYDNAMKQKQTAESALTFYRRNFSLKFLLDLLFANVEK